jgi:trans-2,3-dihydro-3-hydroxyanthranilate isomerase
MTQSFRYLHYDVFTSDPFTGNQLAVFPDARGLTAEQMQRITAEMAFSETTFVLPPEDAATDVRMRIFTPRTELPMAGHPTVGSTFALAHEGVIAAQKRTFTFGLGVGPTPVELVWRDSELSFAWMTQPLPQFGAAIEDLDGVAAALGLAPSDVLGGPPPQIVTSGVPHLFVALAKRAAVDRAALARPELRRVLTAVGSEEIPCFVFSLQPGDDDATAYSRNFGPTFGIVEDPATGGASGPLGAYLVHHGAVARQPALEIVSRQGVVMGRPSRVYIGVESVGEAITRVRVGGESVLVAEGLLFA